MRYSLTLAIPLFLVVTGATAQDTLVIHFDLNSSLIRPADTAQLDSLVRTQDVISGKRQNMLSVTIAGHADSTAGDRYNDSLSLLRAQTTQRYLLSKGLPAALIKSIDGYGRRRPRDPQDPALNRRVEIIVIRNNPSPPVPPPMSKEEQEHTLQQAFSDTAHLAGKNIILRNVNFYGDRHIPLPEAYLELRQLLTVMRQHPRMVIQIQGYVCCMRDDLDGRDADIPTQPLSVQRAKFVYDFLVEQGIAKSRLSYKGFGAGNKIYPLERTEEEKRANRRVEIKVITP